MVAETWASTEIADSFLQDVLNGAIERFGLTFRPEMVRKRQYVSELVVRLDPALTGLNERFANFCNLLDSLFSKHHLPPFELTGIVCAQDTSATAYKPPGFIVERKHGIPFSENRYWSRSPLPTKDHLLAINEFEKFLST